MNENFNPLVSIVIPVYNGSNFMREAIDSALAQTYKNLEVLVVNDGSSDNGLTKEIALSYGNRIRYLEKTNGGVASALNFGIQEMKGEYFSWLSHDDIYSPEKIEKQILFLKNKNRHSIIYCDFEFLTDRTDLGVNRNSLYRDIKKNGYYALLFNFIHGCTLLIPKHCFEIAGNFNEKLNTTNDYELFFRMLKHFKYEFINLKLVKVRVHMKQDSVIKINEHLVECNKLWISFVDSLSLDEILSLEKSRFIFYKKLHNYLINTSYDSACAHIKAKMDKVYSEHKFINFFITHIPFVSNYYFYDNKYMNKKIARLHRKNK